MQRRAVLSGTGAGVVLPGAGAACGYDGRVLRGGAGSAFAPSNDSKSVKARPLARVFAALLAARPHSTQPWVFLGQRQRPRRTARLATRSRSARSMPAGRARRKSLRSAESDARVGCWRRPPKAMPVRGAASRKLRANFARTASQPEPRGVAHVGLGHGQKQIRALDEVQSISRKRLVLPPAISLALAWGYGGGGSPGLWN